jgi:hypothetical protein
MTSFSDIGTIPYSKDYTIGAIGRIYADANAKPPTNQDPRLSTAQGDRQAEMAQRKAIFAAASEILEIQKEHVDNFNSEFIEKEWELVIIVDNSGSTGSTMKSGITRYEVIEGVAKISMCLGTYCDPTGSDVYFLNGESKRIPNIKDPQVLENEFARGPSGLTPLASTLRSAITDNLTVANKLAILVITDGAPSEENHWNTGAVTKGTTLLAEVLGDKDLRPKDADGKDRVRIGFRPVYDGTLEYLENFDTGYTGVSVISDYPTEYAQVQQHNPGAKFTVGDHAATTLLSIVSDHYDNLDEKRVAQGTGGNVYQIPPGEGGCCVVS